VYHLYVVRSPVRDALREHLSSAGVGTAVHYPTPVHMQAAYATGARGAGGLGATERLAREIVSLPAFPGLGEERVAAVAAAVRAFDAGYSTRSA
jgi:dTDP-4-amino-4,6-dideoxygalactose transaminase